MIINKLKDDELIFFLSLHGDQASRSIKSKYTQKSSFLINETLTRYPKISSSKDILMNLCFYSLNKTIRKSDLREIGFYSYWKRSSINLMKDIMNKESKYFYNFVSLDKEIHLKDSLLSLHEVIPSIVEKPSNKLNENEIKELLKDKGFDMDIKQKRLFKYFLKGHTYSELQDRFPEYSRSKIYRIIQQCKDKIKSTISYREIK